jgi:hypothetical protein
MVSRERSNSDSGYMYGCLGYFHVTPGRPKKEYEVGVFVWGDSPRHTGIIPLLRLDTTEKF